MSRCPILPGVLFLIQLGCCRLNRLNRLHNFGFRVLFELSPDAYCLFLLFWYCNAHGSAFTVKVSGVSLFDPRSTAMGRGLLFSPHNLTTPKIVNTAKFLYRIWISVKPNVHLL